MISKGDKEALLKALSECKDNKDIEAAHCDADDSLLEYIGDDEIRDAFEAIDKWYA